MSDAKKARESIELGNVPVEYFLGVFYTKGYGTEKNEEKSLQWLRAFLKESTQNQDVRKHETMIFRQA